LLGARLAIVVLDGSEPLQDGDMEALRSIPEGVYGIAVVNKSDLPQALSEYELDGLGIVHCHVSALTGDGLDTLAAQVQGFFTEPDKSPPFGELITNARQADAISRAMASLGGAVDAINASVTPDAILVEIEDALKAIGEVTGKTFREDVIARIFERFCVGK
jgi:tRNA modification GTPase